jgi:L-fucose isomerase-like protein
MKPVTLGVIVGNRGFFPKHLCVTGRETVLKVLEEEGIKAIAVGLEETPYGSVESIADAHKLADLFRAHRDEIDGVLITLPNFGDERAIANAMRWSELNVPVLIQAFPDDAKNMTIKDRRDSFCGKMSHCNNLKQVWHQVLADQVAHDRPGEQGIPRRPGPLWRHLPHRARSQARPHRRHRRPPAGVQHRAL